MLRKVGKQVNERFEPHEKHQPELIAQECADDNDYVHRDNPCIRCKHDGANVWRCFFVQLPRVHIGKEMIDEKYCATDEYIHDVHRVAAAKKGD